MIYKLTDQNGRSQGLQWGPDTTHICSSPDALLEAYEGDEIGGPLLALLLNPVHGEFIENPRLWLCDGRYPGYPGHPLRVGFGLLTTVREVNVPEATLEQRVRFAILCATEAYVDTHQKWKIWAEKWLAGERDTDEADMLTTLRIAPHGAVSYALNAAWALERSESWRDEEVAASAARAAAHAKSARSYINLGALAVKACAL